MVAKVGIVIVFFGVAFLLRYTAERGMLPIQYRLMSTAAGALVLLGVGWRLRHSRREYGVVLQGGAVGVLYLTIFAAFRLYDLLPATLTFSLLLMVVAFSGVLAVVQSAMSLAVIGTSGGFLRRSSPPPEAAATWRCSPTTPCSTRGWSASRGSAPGVS